MRLSQIFCNILVDSIGSDFMDFISGLSFNLTEPLAQILVLRFVGCGLNVCVPRLRYGCHNSFSTSNSEIFENNIKMYKTPL